MDVAAASTEAGTVSPWPHRLRRAAPRRLLGGGGRAGVAARLAGVAHHPAGRLHGAAPGPHATGVPAGLRRRRPRRVAPPLGAHGGGGAPRGRPSGAGDPGARCDVGSGLGGRSAAADDPQRQPLRREPDAGCGGERRSSPPMSTCSCSSRSRATCRRRSSRRPRAALPVPRAQRVRRAGGSVEAIYSRCRSSPARSSRSPIGLPARHRRVGDTSVDVLAVHVSDPRLGVDEWRAELAASTRSPIARRGPRCSPATSTAPAGTRSTPICSVTAWSTRWRSAAGSHVLVADRALPAVPGDAPRPRPRQRRGRRVANRDVTIPEAITVAWSPRAAVATGVADCSADPRDGPDAQRERLASRTRDARRLRSTRRDGPLVMAGDFDATRWNPQFADLLDRGCRTRSRPPDAAVVLVAGRALAAASRSCGSTTTLGNAGDGRRDRPRRDRAPAAITSV